jgi:LmbE family N-acetylglucosaminyl deacetylase
MLCLTRGAASTLNGVAGELAEIRAGDLAAAAEVLGVFTVELLRYRDGHLADTPADELALQVIDLAQRLNADGLLVFDPSGVTGHPDHRQATAAALVAAAELDLPVLGWTLPTAIADTLNREYPTSFAGHQDTDIDVTVAVDRHRQYQAVRQHPSQALPTSVLWRRLELLGLVEHLRWLHSPGRAGPA